MNRFLEEVKKLEKRWKKSGLLDGMGDRFGRKQAAVLLECQRLTNEQEPCCEECAKAREVENAKADE